MVRIDKRPLHAVAASDDTRYTLASIRLSRDPKDPETVVAEATNGRIAARLHLSDSPADTPGLNGSPVLVPTALWKHAASGGNKRDARWITIESDNGRGDRVRLKAHRQHPKDAAPFTSYALAETAEAERFPDMERVIPEARLCTARLALNVDYLHALARALTREGEAPCVVLSWDPEMEGSIVRVEPITPADPRDVGVIMPLRPE